jgi:hypothetical protein
MLRPERAARMVEYHSRNKGFPGLAELLDKLLSSTWEADQKPGYHAQIQRVVNNVLLFNLMKLATDEKASVHVRAVACLKLDELKNWLTKKINSIKDENQKAHYFYAVSQIRLFQDDPNKVKLTAPLSPPRGAPIGTYNR